MANGALSKFLKERKAAYLTAVDAGKGGDWTVVMGNEAGGASPTDLQGSIYNDLYTQTSIPSRLP